MILKLWTIYNFSMLWHFIVAVVIFGGFFTSVVDLYNMHQVYITHKKEVYSVLSNLFGIVCKCFIRLCCIDQCLSGYNIFFF